jgi:hypothetical protein
VDALNESPDLHGLDDEICFQTYQKEFRNEMQTLSAQERGAWGEFVVSSEVKKLGQRILLEHANQSTLSGYDCVSWDSRNKVLHVWEAKNYSADQERFGLVNDFSALDFEKRKERVEKFLKWLPIDDPERIPIVNAIQDNHVQCHIRLGPDTDVKITPLEKLEWDSLDVKQYNYAEMLKLRG